MANSNSDGDDDNSSNAPSPCIVCRSPAHLTCIGACKQLPLCSLECWETIWPSHSPMCSQLNTFRERPAKGMFRVVYFPPEGNAPRFRWLAGDLQQRGGYAGLGELMAGARVQLHRVARLNWHNGHEYEAPLGLFHGGHLANEDDVPNRAMVATAQGMCGFSFSGPLVACRVSDEGDGTVGDMTVEDFQHLAFYFMNAAAASRERGKGSGVEGVMLPCRGERRVTGVESSKAVTVAALHPIWRRGVISPISERVRMPLLALPYSLTRREWNHEAGDFDNMASAIITNIDPSSKRKFGRRRQRWPAERGNVLVVRMDQQKLEPDAVEAFAEFCHRYITRHFPNATNMEALPAIEEPGRKDKAFRKALLRDMTPRSWETYLQNWRMIRAGSATALQFVDAPAVGDFELRDDKCSPAVSHTESSSLRWSATLGGKKVVAALRKRLGPESWYKDGDEGLCTELPALMGVTSPCRFDSTSKRTTQM